MKKINVIDYETMNPKNPKLAIRPFNKNTKIFSYCIGHPSGHVEIRRLDTDRTVINRKNYKRLIQFWEDTTIEKIAHNALFELCCNLANGIPIPRKTILHDPMIQHQLLRNLAPAHGLAFLNWELNDPMIYSYGSHEFNSKQLDKYVKTIGTQIGYQNINKTLFDMYQVADGQRPMLLHQLLYPEILKNGKLLKDYNNEMKLIKATARMQQYGLNIDKENCFNLIKWLENELLQIEHETYDYVGKYFNLGSPKHVNHLIYSGELIPKYPIYGFTKTGQPSVDKNILMALREKYPKELLFDLIMKHRSYTKGIANIKSYINFANDQNIINHNILTNRAKTGREAANNPNLQNVEKESAMLNPFPVRARSCFSARPKHILYFFDFKGIELVLIVEAANCINMINRMKSGEHPHIIFCKLMFGEHLPKEKQFISKKLNKDLYNGGKNGHFCLCYGGGIGKLSTTVGLSINEVLPGYNTYKKEFPEIVNLVSSGIQKISEIGYVTTPFGRDFWIPNDKIYGWLNYYIQATAAGIIKRAQVRIDKYLYENWRNSGIQIVLPIHDEIVISYPRTMLKYKNEIFPDIKKIMISMEEIKAPLDIEAKKTTTTWDLTKDFTI